MFLFLDIEITFHYKFSSSNLQCLPLGRSQNPLCITLATHSLLGHHISHGWRPTKEHLPQQLHALWHFCDELSVADGILLKSIRTIVPPSLRPHMLNKIHQSHRGPKYCLCLDRDAILWPSILRTLL